jgi:hypothetical protein
LIQPGKIAVHWQATRDSSDASREGSSRNFIRDEQRQDSAASVQATNAARKAESQETYPGGNATALREKGRGR